MKRANLVLILLSSALSACGGGSSPTPTPAPINVDIPALGANTVPNAPKPFTGAFVMLQGESIGYVSATSPRAIVEAVAVYVMAEPVKNAGLYQAMLSDAGLKVTIVGESIGKSSVTGLPIYAPNVVYTVKLTNAGIVIS